MQDISFPSWFLNKINHLLRKDICKNPSKFHDRNKITELPRPTQTDKKRNRAGQETKKIPVQTTEV